MRTLLIAAAIAALTQAQPARRPAPPVVTPVLAPVVVETDLACTLTLDGEDQGELPANGTKTLSLPPGEHVFRAISTADSTIVWRRVVQIAGSERRAVLIELQPLLDRKRAAETDKVKADEAARAEERRRADEAEKARVERERAAADAARVKEAEQRANEATKALVETQRMQIEKEVAADALKVRDEVVQRWVAEYTDKKGKVDPEISVSVTAAAEGDHRVLVFELTKKTREIKRFVTKVALVQWKGAPAFRFTMRHVHAKECVGAVMISNTRMAYDPTTPQYKQDAFDVEKIQIDSPGKVTRTGMLKIDLPQRNLDMVIAFETAPGSWDFVQRPDDGMVGVSFDNAVQEWARRALTDFAGTKKDFERATADVKLTGTR
jgi:hypothetical protein